jgi:MFS family permease
MSYSRQYETRMVAILCLVFGIVNFELFSVSYLIAFIEPSLKLSNTQIGALSSGFWVTFAVSSYVAGVWTDRLGRHKSILYYSLLLFSVASILSGCASSFVALLAARVLMGLLEGPVYLLPQSIIVLESPPERSGLNMGVMQNIGSNALSGFVAPLLLVRLAGQYGWRVGFFVVMLPGLLCATLVSRYLREPNVSTTFMRNEAAAGSEASEGLLAILRFRNVWLCMLSASLVVAYFTIGVAFLPLVFVKIRQLSAQQMSVLMSVLGVSGVVLGVALPALADRIGRRPVVTTATLLGMVCPVAALYYPGSITVLGLLVFFGWAPAGVTTLILATIPAESVPTRSMSTAIGLIVAVGTLTGGVFGPSIAGWSADHWGLRASLFLETGCIAAAALLSLALHETAPGRNKVASPSV